MLGNSVATAATALFTNNLPPADLRSLVPKIAPRRVFFVYGEQGQSVEEPANRAFYADAREPKSIWEVPDGRTRRRDRGAAGGVRAASDRRSSTARSFRQTKRASDDSSGGE